MENRFSFSNLNTFRVVALEGGVTAAAQVLRVSASSISVQIQNLEGQIGRPLFVRQKKRLILTETGRVVLDYAKEIFRLGQEMVEAAHDRLEDDRLHLHIGVFPGVPKSLLMSLIERVNDLGNCLLSFSESSGAELFREFQTGSVDLLLTNTPQIPGGEMREALATRLHSHPLWVCGHPKFRSLAIGFPESLEQQPFILPRQSGRRRHAIDHYFQIHQIQIRCVAEMEDSALQKSLALKGMGLVAIPDLVAKKMIADKKMIKIGVLGGVIEEYWLLATGRRVKHPIIARLMKDPQL